MTVVVTGAAGFIGLNLVEHLLWHTNESIVAVDNLSFGSDAAVMTKLCADYEDRVSFLEMDVCAADFNYLIQDLGQAHIYHLAANSSVDRSISDPVQCIHNNVMGTLNVIEAHANFGDETELLIVSTDEVYGDEGPFPTPWGSLLKGSSPYSSSKAAADLIAQSYNRTYGLNIKISRCCNNFGKYQHLEKFLPTITKSISEGKPIPIYGDGLQFRQWVPVSEHARRLHELMLSDASHAHVGGYSISNLDLVATISKLLGKELNICHVEDRPGHDRKYELEDTEAVGFDKFEAALKDYLVWRGLI